jgi:hypothetical protein
MVVGEPEIEIENVPYLVTDEGYEAACESMSLGVEGVILRSSIHTFNALHIYSITKSGRHGRNGANLRRNDMGVIMRGMVALPGTYALPSF